MMVRKSSAALLLMLSFVAAARTAADAQPSSPLTHHVREVTLNGQAPLVGYLPAEQTMRLVLVLPLRNQAELENCLHELYDPSSPAYRHFLTVEEFTARFGPSRKDYDTVIRFAEANGFNVVGRSRNRMNLDITASVANIEQAFHLMIGLYQHPTEDRTFYAPDREPTPKLAVQLWHIAGLDNYSIPRPALVHRENLSDIDRGTAKTGSGPEASFLGSDMRAAYYGGSLTGTGQSLGLVEFSGTDLADLNMYYATVGQTNPVPIILLSTDGTPASCVSGKPGCDDTEQTIDMTQALGMAPGMSSLVMYVGRTSSAIFNAVATASPLEAQLSSSWTWKPADASTDDPYFKEFAAQGQNLFQASGDEGEWTETLAGKQKVYPADDAYITSVGGTVLKTTGAAGPRSSETAWSHSGGGISPDNFEIPAWQAAAASGCASCSQSYRNGPDVAANASVSFYVCSRQTCSANKLGGTSFAAPMWAGYLALANEQSVTNSGKTLGFINPSLYMIGLGSSYSSDFHDVIKGCQFDAGFCATAGYDLVTGWGSPNGSALVGALALAP